VLASDDFDPKQSVILDAMPPNYQQNAITGGNVEVLHYTTNQAQMKVTTTRDAILVFSDSYYPGWVADIDGTETTIYRANITQRAVVVPAGEHQVKFRFRPVTVIAGSCVSLASLLLLLGCFLLLRRREAAA
jgi:uncharacterized membrane protein YfhO